MDREPTYEELAEFAAGDMEGGRTGEIEAHLPGCAECRRRLAALREADALLRALPRPEPSVRAVLDTRKALAAETRAPRAPEILTLEEVAEFLRVSPEELAEVAGELPAFEVGGQVRVRRERLLEWVERREGAYARQTAESGMTVDLGGGLRKEVARWLRQ